MKHPGVENINIVVKVKIDMSWIDAMKLRLAGLPNPLEFREEKS